MKQLHETHNCQPWTKPKWTTSRWLTSSKTESQCWKIIMVDHLSTTVNLEQARGNHLKDKVLQIRSSQIHLHSHKSSNLTTLRSNTKHKVNWATCFLTWRRKWMLEWPVRITKPNHHYSKRLQVLVQCSKCLNNLVVWKPIWTAATLLAVRCGSTLRQTQAPCLKYQFKRALL